MVIKISDDGMFCNFESEQDTELAALTYARLGWCVLPLWEKDKRPITKAGVNDACANEDQIMDWFGQESCPNVGIALQKSALIALDADSQEQVDMMDELLRSQAVKTLISKTKRGCHYIFRVDWVKDFHRYFKYLGVNVEVKHKGYIVAPPSIHPKGGRYVWMNDYYPALLPEVIEERIVKPVRCPVTRSTREKVTTTVRKNPDPIDTITLKKEAESVATTTEGDRNNQLFKSSARCGELEAEGKLNQEDITRELTEAALKAGLEEDEILRTIESGLRTGSQSSNHCRVYKNTDLGNSERLVDIYGDCIRYCEPNGSWYVWNEKVWGQDREGKAIEMAKRTVREIYKEASKAETDGERTALVKHAKKSESQNSIFAMVRLAKSSVPIVPEVFDTDKYLLNAQNGTIDLKTGDLLQHDKGKYITKIVPVNYDPNATAPLWEKFLDKIFNSDKELIEFMQRAVGYSLTGDISEHGFFILYGKGANGKTTFLNTIMYVLGDYATTAAPDLLLVKRQQHPTELAELKEVRLVSANETGGERWFNESRVKQLTGGDKIKGRFMHKDFFEFYPTHKLFLATNHCPSVQGMDRAFWRRVNRIPFLIEIPKDRQDRKLEEKLKNEAEGILSWAIRGCLAWRSVELSPPTVVMEDTEKYRRETDVLGAFIEDCCYEVPGASEGARILYNAYKDWCEKTGEKVLPERAFSQALQDRGYDKTRRSDGKYYLGIELSEPQEEPYSNEGFD